MGRSLGFQVHIPSEELPSSLRKPSPRPGGLQLLAAGIVVSPAGRGHLCLPGEQPKDGLLTGGLLLLLQGTQQTGHLAALASLSPTS